MYFNMYMYVRVLCHSFSIQNGGSDAGPFSSTATGGEQPANDGKPTLKLHVQYMYSVHTCTYMYICTYLR